MSDKAKQLAEDHWNGYVGPMMESMMKCAIEMSRFHYISSHVHGSKHGKEEQVETSREAFANPAVHYTHQAGQGGDCTIGGVECWQCGDYAESEPREIVIKTVELRKSPYTFPPALKFITGEYTGQHYLDKLREEVDELATEINRFNHTQNGNLHNLLMEAWDVAHTVETYIRRVCQTHGIDPAVSLHAVVNKNAARGYYDELVVKPSIMDCAGISYDQCEEKTKC